MVASLDGFRSLARAGAGPRLHALLTELFPICRSITGDGVRQTLDVLARELPLELHEVPSGSRVLDWDVPPEWNIRAAWIDGPAGERVLDFGDSNLHVVSYSTPVRERMTLEELRPHLHSLPDRPDWIPYRTTYYETGWGFCLQHHRLQGLPDGEYEVCIDSALEPGSLTYGEVVLPGSTDEEVLISAHVCHPSLANDNLSGVVVAAEVASSLQPVAHRYTYRFVFAPGTIGAITWLAGNLERLDRIRGGLVVTGVGNAGGITYKRSRRGDAEIDRAAALVLRDSAQPHEIRGFTPLGYDERQYCSPGFDLPVGCVMRTPWGEYPEYHTSADDPGLVAPEQLASAATTILDVLAALEANERPVGTRPCGEPQLSRHGVLEPDDDGTVIPAAVYQWILNYADGEHDLLRIAELSALPFELVRRGAARLRSAGLLRTNGR
jgi:aminopeptidase-like protein